MGKGSYYDNIFIERLWRSLKYEEVYIREYRDGMDARRSIGRYVEFYNHVRPHASLQANTPSMVYRGKVELRK